MSEEQKKKSKLHRAPTGFNFKHHIQTLEDEMQLALFGLIGILLIAFPERLRDIVPYLTGIALLAYGIICLVHCLRFHEEDEEPGFDVIYIVLGAAILYHRENSLGAIGSIWALFTLTEVAEEINEAYHFKKFSIVTTLIGIASTALAILLMFDPVEHFAFHVRILGIEMILSIFARWGNKKEPDEVPPDEIEEFAEEAEEELEEMEREERLLDKFEDTEQEQK